MYKSRKLKAILLLLCVSTLTANEPTSPDFSGYTSVGNNQIVNKFTGSLNYSIPVVVVPGPDGSDYQIALSYSSGVQPDQQASWVGYGWSLSPGAITRQKKGFPDDYNDQEVKYWQKFRPSLTATKNVLVRTELLSKDQESETLEEGVEATNLGPLLESARELGFSANYSRSTTLNNNNGYSVQNTLGVGAGAFGSLSATWNQKGVPTYFYDLNLVALLRKLGANSDDNSSESKKKSFSEKSLSRLENQAIGMASGMYSTRSVYNAITSKGSGRFPSSTSEFKGSQTTFAPTFGLSLGFMKIEGEPGLTMTQIVQEPLPEQPLIKKGFGYINSHNATEDKDVMDYYTEKQSEFTKDDKFLPIPFSNADNFHVTCKELGGSFRAWSRKVNEFRPNKVISRSNSSDFGTTLVVGIDGTINFGVGYGDGWSKSETFGWMSDDFGIDLNKSNQHNAIPQYYFKFHNDLGQNNSFYSGGTSAGDYHSPEGLDVVLQDINSLFNFPYPSPTNQGSVNFNNDILASHNSILRQSKSIQFNTNQDLFFDNQNMRKFSKSSEYIEGVSDDIITEFKITNENGKKFIFGLPVFSRNERSLSYGINKISYNTSLDKAYTENSKIVYHHITPQNDEHTNDKPTVILGQELEEPYVGSYLVTEILSNNYVDINNDGPSQDDIGGYTVFDYKQVYGSDNKKEGADYDWAKHTIPAAKTSNWYKWRTPVAGYNYDRNSQSDRGDDLISFSSGEKEVYNLEAISTKSHVAIFITNKSSIEVSTVEDGVTSITGSDNVRKDGYESEHSEWEAGKNDKADIDSEKNIKYLERIELWKLDELVPFSITQSGEKRYNLVKKLQTTHFDYDYSAWVGLPNSEANAGKLTLKKVWTESGDNKSDYQNPYIFEYTSFNPINYPSYAEISTPTPAKDEDPTYDILDIDAWGNYRDNSISSITNGRYFQEQNWVYQNKGIYTGNNYDPSAWNLKQIKLPSTGRILIDYEENEYTRVQDENPMTMVSIADDGYDEANHKITLNVLNDLGLDATDPDESDIIDDIVNLIQEKYVDGDEKIYFNFLYSLVGPKVYNDITNCASEYIDGFIGVYSVGLVNDKIVITLKNSGDVFLPQQICKDFFYSSRYGIYDPNSSEEPPCCKSITVGKNIEYTEKSIEKLTDELGFMLIGSNSHSTNEDKICRNVNLELSYLRIPLPESFPKLGGGVRVKRVLYLDEFDTKTGDGPTSRLYGNEYVYENNGGTSSGVAGNEPQSIIKENPFYKPIVKRNSTSVYSAGNQVANLLGPFGASILPSASIGYSRVLSKSFFDNEHHPGFTIDSFLTYKDYPVYGLLSSNSDFDELFKSVGENKKELKGFSWTNILDPKKRLIIDPGFTPPSPYVSLSSKAIASQGFQFITHSYNGKPASSITYGGRYDNKETWNIGSSTEYEYFDIGEKIPVINEKFQLRNSNIGRDEEIVMEGRFNENTTVNWKAEGDLSFKLPVFIPTEAGGYGNYSTFSKQLKTHTTNKIISYPAIAKKVTTFADGVTTVKENTAFDINTGQPFITSINDKYSKDDRNDSYYQVLDIPTSYIYEEFNQKSQGVVNTFVDGHRFNKSITRKIRDNGTSLYYFINMDGQKWGAYSYEFIKHFNVGDIIEVSLANGEILTSDYKEYYRIKKVLSDVLVIEPIISGTVQSNPISDMRCNIKIIESGKQNLLNSKAAKIVKENKFYSEGNEILKGESYNAYLDEFYPQEIPNLIGINSISDAINDLLKAIFDDIFLNSTFQPSNRVIYDDALTNDKDYSEPIDFLSNSTDGDTKKESVDIVGSMVGVQYYNLEGEIETSTPSLIIEDVRFKNGELENYERYCQDKFINIAFDLCWDRTLEESITYTNGVQPNLFTDDLNNIINSSWHLEISDILIKYGLYEKIKHKDALNIFHPYISQSLNESIDGLSNEFWEEISDRIGLSSLNSTNYSLLNEKDSEYLRILEKENLYIISYRANENSKSEVYLADFYLKNIQEIDGDPSINGIEVGFTRNIIKSNNLNFANSNLYNFNHSDPEESYNKFIIKTNSLQNTFVSTNTSNSVLFNDIRGANDYPSSTSGLYFTINANNNDTELNVNFKNIFQTLDDELVSEDGVNILPLTLAPDRCCRTYLAVFKRVPYPLTNNSSYHPFTLINPISDNYFGFKNGQISDLGFDDEHMCITGDYPELDTNYIGFNGIAPLEAGEFCIRFAPDEDLVYSIDSVYAATVADYKDDWDTDKTSTYFDANDGYSTGKKGRWMSHKSYVYKNPIEKATAFTGSAQNTLDNKGLLRHYNDVNDYFNNEYIDFILFNWKIPEVNNEFRWISQSEITSVNDLNQPEQEKSIIGLNSSVFYSESDLKPILYVNNANKDEIFYSSGDCNIPNEFYPYVGTEKRPHSGNDVYYLENLNDFVTINLDLEENKTYLLKYWVYHDDGVGITFIQDLNLEFRSNGNPINSPDIQTSSVGYEKVRVGNWDLITHEITTTVPTYPNLFSNVEIKLITQSPDYSFDDLLFIPIEASSKCISYNCENDRVEAEFDSEHFATFFDYDHEGRLIRKRKETYRGVKNIAETFYNTPKVDITASGSSGSLTIPKKDYDVDVNRRNNNINKTIQLKSGETKEESGNKFDIFDLKLDQDGLDTKLFNTDTDEIKENLDSLRKKVKEFKIDSLNKELNFNQLESTKELENKFNQKYNQLDSLKVPDINLDTTGVEQRLKEKLESEAIKNGNHNTKIRKGK